MRSSDRGTGVLILVPGKLSARLSGPEIRAIRLGQALAGRHTVTLMAPGDTWSKYGGLAVVPYSRRRLLREARRHDVVLGSTVPPFLLALKKRLGIRVVSDQYDPVELEIATLGEGAERAKLTARDAHRLQLRGADIVLCAGRRQQALLEAEVDAAGSPGPLICTVPFGIDLEPPPAAGRPLRDHFRQIEADDKIVLWWGSLWRWLDPETAIRAVASLAEGRPDVKLVFTAGRAPNGAMDRHSVLGEARELAARLGVLDRSVLFFDHWVPFADRADYLRDADIGLTLHRDTEEAGVAARARYMDYLWAGLPCVLGRGDETGKRFGESGFANLVEAGSPAETANAIVDLLEEERLREAADAGRALAEEFSWPQLAAPLVSALSAPAETWSTAAARPGLYLTTQYYARRAVDHLLASA